MKAFTVYIFLEYLFAILILISPAYTCAQHFSSRLYNVTDGLPGASTYEADEDSYGYLWICTSAGLSCFDGRQFVSYSLIDGLPSLHVLNVFEDGKKRLWVGTNAGMAQFKNNKFITYPLSDNQNNIWVFQIMETRDKHVWAATSKGVYEFENNFWKKLILFPGFENSICRQVVETKEGLYINYGSDIVCRDKKGNWLHIESDQDYGSFFNVMSLQKNEIWVSTIKNIYAIRNHQLSPILIKDLPGKSFFSYLIDSKNRLWLAGKYAIAIYKPNDWRDLWDSIINQYGYTFKISEDSSHNFWIGTSSGLLELNEIDFKIIYKKNNAPLTGIYNTMALSNNRLIFSSSGKTGLLVYQNNSFKQIKRPQTIDKKSYYTDLVDSYTFDAPGSLWMTTRFNRLLHFDGKKLEDFSTALHLKTTESIYAIAYAKERNKFFVCADSTLLYGTNLKFSTFIPRNTGLPIIKPTRVFVAKNGLIIIYVDGIGVYGIDAENDLIPLIKETGIDGSKKGIEIRVCFYGDANNNFWIAFPGLGVYEYGFTINKLLFLKKHFTIKDGLQNNDVNGITGDKQNRLWIASNIGLDILQLNKHAKYEVFNYAKADEFNLDGFDLEKLTTDAKGNVWLSSPDKVIKFDPGNVSLHKETPRINIEKVTLAFGETNWSRLADSLYGYERLPYDPVLKYNQNSLGIFFNANDLSTSNSASEYSYKLFPLDTSWSFPVKTKSVSFAQLPPGKYRFYVKAKDLASPWSVPAVFSFTIKSPFWDQWWFRLAVIALAAFIIINIFKSRVRRIRNDAFVENQLKEMEMKALKAQMNPHFVFNAINSIQALVANDRKMEGIHYIGSFSRLLRLVFENSEKNVISLDKELETVGLYIQLETLRLNMELHYTKNIPENVVPEYEKIPPLILQPFFENALWHGLSSKEGRKEITIAVSIEDQWLICDIIDNGIGRAKALELKEKSPGIHLSKAIEITRKRLIDFNGDATLSPIEFKDIFDPENNPSGTKVTVRIKRKINDSYFSFNKSM
ncbi:MAG: two-component regulator propeller domain-containing protein [Ginsengibacter sp.]